MYAEDFNVFERMEEFGVDSCPIWERKQCTLCIIYNDLKVIQCIPSLALAKYLPYHL
jgi:hypothetical protein